MRISQGEPAKATDVLIYRRKLLLPLDLGLCLDVGGGNAQTEAIRDRGQIIVLNLCSEGYDGVLMPRAGNFFNSVTCFATLEHVEDEYRTLQEIYRVLQYFGCLYLTVPNRWWIFETHGAWLWGPWNRVPFFSWLPKALHDRWAKARIYTRCGIEEKLKNHGFTIERSCYLTAPMDVARPRWLQRLLRKTVFQGTTTHIPFLATEIFIEARKPASRGGEYRVPNEVMKGEDNNETSIPKRHEGSSGREATEEPIQWSPRRCNQAV